MKLAHSFRACCSAAVLLICQLVASHAAAAETGSAGSIDFNRDVRPLLSNRCYRCHGPDEQERQGGGASGLRLDTPEGAREDLGGYAAIVPGKPDESELMRRVLSQDEGEIMPPPEAGARLTEAEIQTLRAWIEQDAPYATHWSYVKPRRPALPEVRQKEWPQNEIDYFILARLEQEGLTPSPPADRYALIRRVSLDLTGLPPTLEEVEQFVNDPRSDAYERLVDRLLKKTSYGERWARVWLDLARYADSAGYADDPPRTIWGYRDYVIRSFNANKPFDQFTIEQIAGDLLPNPTDEQLIATAFHRNTMTNNEGGTNDEEFRNVAVVDRVNTTMAVWMGTTMACAQCHSHKYDPITQEEYFRLFAILNNTADADRMDESPVLEVFSDEQREQQRSWETEREKLERQLDAAHPELADSQQRWEADLRADIDWEPVAPDLLTSSSGASLETLGNGIIQAARGAATETYTLEAPLSTESVVALRLETLPDANLPGGGAGHGGGNFVLSRITASLLPPPEQRTPARYVRLEIAGNDKILALAEVQVFVGDENIAPRGTATQSSTAFEGPAELAIDGNTDGDYFAARSTTHTAISANPWWQLDLGSPQPIDRIIVWNRTDGNFQSRLAGCRVQLLDEQRQTVWETTITDAPATSLELPVDYARPIAFTIANADYSQEGFAPQHVLNNPDVATRGWAVGGQIDQPHTLTLVASEPAPVLPGSRLRVTIDQLSQHSHHTLGRFRLATTADPQARMQTTAPAEIRALARTSVENRTAEQREQLARYYTRHVAPELQPARERIADLTAKLAAMQPMTTVPILRELPSEQRRTTHIQHRGNFLDLGDEVEPGLPAAFHPLPDGAAPDRLGLARWLVAPDNPLTPRVMANLFWEQIFGIGIVSTSEEFGSQGELPSHPELLDWLATDFVRQHWDVKAFLKMIVTSATYQQSSRVTPELYERDPDNRLLARGPRFRLPAEAIRDQALFVSGLLSPKMYGPPVKPPQPELGLAAAFGSRIDWQTSDGEDRYRRGLYTTWRRSNPYPSMASFDAPNREVCTIRRVRTNTPLQALVTLNDPVYVEAAQALARRMMESAQTAEERADVGFRLCLAREPAPAERTRLVELYEQARTRFANQTADAITLAGIPSDANSTQSAVEAAAWTVVANVLLNLDEFLMKR